VTDPVTGEPIPAADMREAFSRMSTTDRPDEHADAERAFVDGRLEMIRSDPALTEAQKEAPVDEVLQKLHRPAPDGPPA
jgi:hypothetical protein